MWSCYPTVLRLVRVPTTVEAEEDRAVDGDVLGRLHYVVLRKSGEIGQAGRYHGDFQIIASPNQRKGIKHALTLSAYPQPYVGWDEPRESQQLPLIPIGTAQPPAMQPNQQDRGHA
jgi:hypothetical protein